MDAHRLQLQKRSEISGESEVIRGEGKDAQGIPISNEISRIKELESEVKSLREEARKLSEEKEDLQAQVINGSVIAGQTILQTAASMSIADELNDLSEQQVCVIFGLEISQWTRKFKKVPANSIDEFFLIYIFHFLRVKF